MKSKRDIIISALTENTILHKVRRAVRRGGRFGHEVHGMVLAPLLALSLRRNTIKDKHRFWQVYSTGAIRHRLWSLLTMTPFGIQTQLQLELSEHATQKYTFKRAIAMPLILKYGA